MKKTANITEQFSPSYGYDECGRWNGMTPEEVKARIADMRRAMLLFHWTPSSPAN